MAEKISIVGKTTERIVDTSPSQRRISDEEFAAALGAEPIGERRSKHLDLISLGELGNELIKRLRSTGGRPSLEGATERCKVPLSPEDIAGLELVIDAVERQTGTRPALGQIASVILRVHLDALKDASSQHDPSYVEMSENEKPVSLRVVQSLIDQQIKPIKEELRRQAKS